MNARIDLSFPTLQATASRLDASSATQTVHDGKLFA
jgi:hypothetical protein